MVYFRAEGRTKVFYYLLAPFLQFGQAPSLQYGHNILHWDWPTTKALHMHVQNSNKRHKIAKASKSVVGWSHITSKLLVLKEDGGYLTNCARVAAGLLWILNDEGMKRLCYEWITYGGIELLRQIKSKGLFCKMSLVPFPHSVRRAILSDVHVFCTFLS